MKIDGEKWRRAVAGYYVRIIVVSGDYTHAITGRSDNLASAQEEPKEYGRDKEYCQQDDDDNDSAVHRRCHSDLIIRYVGVTVSLYGRSSRIPLYLLRDDKIILLSGDRDLRSVRDNLYGRRTDVCGQWVITGFSRLSGRAPAVRFISGQSVSVCV